MTNKSDAQSTTTASSGIKNIHIALLVLVFILGGVILAKAGGLWITESTRSPVRYSSGEFTGLANPSDIRGSYTFADIAREFSIETALLSRAFGLDGDNPDFRLNELEDKYGDVAEDVEISTDSVRLFVALYNGLPHTPEETTHLLPPALEILSAKLMPADIDALESLVIKTPGVQTETSTGIPQEDDHGENAEYFIIKGNTSFYDLLQWGLTEEDITRVLGIPMGQRSAILRDYLSDNGLEFSPYKTELQNLINAENNL